ncbi:MAG: T9SS type A sorting domain-containing protein [Bacteroidota bacterium]
MKTKIFITAIMMMYLSSLTGQNYIDKYLTDPLTYTTIGASSNNLNQPRDLDFKPNTNELWVTNKATSAGGSVVIFYNAGQSNQTSQYRKDSHSSHFLMYPSAMAFSDIGELGAVSEIQNTNSQSPTFMGPSLWSSDTSMYARVFQNNWMSNYPLGSHLDMLHQSPFSMGIAHDSAKIYWVFDGYNGNICKYDFVTDHDPGHDDHSAGKIWRYVDVTVSRVPNVPSHMVMDKSTGWLYFVDGGTKMIKRLNTNTGNVTGNLTVPSTASEGLAGYWKVQNATLETFDTLTTQPCGIDFYGNRLIVGDYTNGDIHVYNTSGVSPVEIGVIPTGQAGIMGLKIGTDGKIWFVNATQNKVMRIDPLPVINDASILNITAPIVNNYEPNFYSTKFNQCNTSITPMVTLLNSGSDTLKSATINYQIDNGTVYTFNWTGSLVTGINANVTLPAITATIGEHKLSAFTTNPNSNTDLNSLNDKKEGSFRIINSTFSFPFSEGFSSSTFPPAGWSYLNYNKYNKMSRVGSIGGFGNSNGCIKMDNFSAQVNITGQIDYLMTPRIDLSSAPSGTSLDFSVAYAQYNTSTNDNLKVKISTDCGSTWTTIYNKSGSTLSTKLPQTTAFTPNSSQWRKESLNLSSYIGQADVMLLFATQSNYGNNIFLDDINISNTTGIEENNLDDLFSAYPNPSNGNIYIVGKFELSESIKVSIYNMLGDQVMKTEEKTSQEKLSIKLPDISNGIYLLKICSGNTIYSKKIIISH